VKRAAPRKTSPARSSAKANAGAKRGRGGRR
jgi:hypothetical protein